MSQTGSTYGSAGSPGYNLSLAQFQQRVATAENQCLKCKKGTPGATRYCRALVNARFNRCPDDGKCGEFREDSCALAAAAALEGCTTRSCTSSVCGPCPCKECKKSCSKSTSSCS